MKFETIAGALEFEIPLWRGIRDSAEARNSRFRCSTKFEIPLKREHWRFRCGAKFEISLEPSKFEICARGAEIRRFRSRREIGDFAVERPFDDFARARNSRFRCGAKFEISLTASEIRDCRWSAEFEIPLKREIAHDFA